MIIIPEKLKIESLLDRMNNLCLNLVRMLTNFDNILEKTVESRRLGVIFACSLSDVYPWQKRFQLKPH